MENVLCEKEQNYGYQFYALNVIVLNYELQNKLMI
jgi:hypothetical protein